MNTTCKGIFVLEIMCKLVFAWFLHPSVKKKIDARLTYFFFHFIFFLWFFSSHLNKLKFHFLSKFSLLNFFHSKFISSKQRIKPDEGDFQIMTICNIPVYFVLFICPVHMSMSTGCDVGLMVWPRPIYPISYWLPFICLKGPET